MSRLTAELITTIDGLAPIEDRWRELAEQRSNAFVTPDWFRSWWKHQGRSSEALVSVTRRPDNSVAGVMPLVLDQSRRPRAVRFAGASLGDRFHPVSGLEEEGAVAMATMEVLEGAGISREMLLFEHTDTQVDWWRDMQGAASLRRVIVEQQQTAVYFVDLCDVDWDGYLAQRSRNFRKQLRRSEKALAEQHGMRIRATNPATLDDDLAELFHLHDLRRGTLDGSSALHAVARDSLKDFARRAVERGWLRLRVMEADEQPVAAVLGWRIGDSYASFQGGFDPAWGKLGVGFVLEALTIRAAIEEGAGEYDFLLGAEDWKRRFTDESRPSQTTLLLRDRRPLRYLVAGEEWLRRLGARLPHDSAAKRVAQTIRGIIPMRRRL